MQKQVDRRFDWTILQRSENYMSNLKNPQSMASQSLSAGQDFKGAGEVFEQMFKIFETGNLEAMFDLLAEDAVMEFPFAPPKRTRQVKGKNNIIKYNQGILGIVKFKGMKDVEIYRTTDPECIIVEMTGYGTILATGDPFERRYIEVCRTKNGRIKLIRDYWNPQDSPKLNFVAKLKVAYSIFSRKLNSR